MEELAEQVDLLLYNIIISEDLIDNPKMVRDLKEKLSIFSYYLKHIKE